MLNIFPTPKLFCPHCNKPMNRLGTPDPETKPVPGSIVFCSECNGLGTLNDDMATIRKLTAQELSILMEDTDAIVDLARSAMIAEYKRRMDRTEKN